MAFLLFFVVTVAVGGSFVVARSGEMSGRSRLYMKPRTKRMSSVSAGIPISSNDRRAPLAAPSMKNDGRNTARMQSMARRRGTAVCALPSRTARAMLGVCSNWV